MVRCFCRNLDVQNQGHLEWCGHPHFNNGYMEKWHRHTEPQQNWINNSIDCTVYIKLDLKHGTQNLLGMIQVAKTGSIEHGNHRAVFTKWFHVFFPLKQLVLWGLASVCPQQRGTPLAIWTGKRVIQTSQAHLQSWAIARWGSRSCKGWELGLATVVSCTASYLHSGSGKQYVIVSKHKSHDDRTVMFWC